jgi:hypothetical protein
LQETHAKALEATAAEREKWTTTMNTSYLAALDKLLAETAKRGDLDAALAIKNERTRITEKKEPTEAESLAMPPALRSQRAGYDAARKRVDEETARRNLAAERTYLAGLEALQKKITMAGDFDQALIVKAERDRITAARSPQLAAATAAVEPESAPAEKAPPPPGAEVIPGTWMFTDVVGKAQWPRYLSVDGSFIGKAAGGVGHWKLENGKVLLSYPDGHIEEMGPPLDPAGTSVVSKTGRKFTAVRKNVQVPFPRAEPPASPADAASAAAVKALVANSRWFMVPGGDLKADSNDWQECYRDGTVSTSWGRKSAWEIIPPKTLHIFDAYDAKHWYIDIDVAKRVGIPNPTLDRNGRGMRYDKRVNTPAKGR